MEEHHHHHPLRQPLIQPSNTTTASNSVVVIDMETTPQAQDFDHDQSSSFNITCRLALVAMFVLLSFWANHEASRGFAVTVINAAGETFAGKRFHLFYVSNDEATRMVIKASNAVETFLYPDNEMASKKEVARIILKLSGSNSSDEIFVGSEGVHFVLNISPSILEGTDFRHDMSIAVQQGVARVWLWDGQGRSPKYLIDGIVGYITSNCDGPGRLPRSLEEAVPPPQEGSSSDACWKSKDPRAVAEYLKYCERRRPGFIARLNRGMKYGWHDDMFSVALGMPVQDLSTSFGPLRYNLSSS